MSEQEIRCPKCKSEFLLVERRPNGNAQCESCNWHGPYKYCFVNKELALLESRIKELEAENKRFLEALEELADEETYIEDSNDYDTGYFPPRLHPAEIAKNALKGVSIKPVSNDTNSKLTSNNINR